MKKLVLAILIGAAVSVNAQEPDAEVELAKKLANPIASLISVPFQFNYDQNIGPDDDGSVYRLNIQPVIPVRLNEDWNIISRTILPIIDQEDVPSDGLGDSGFCDTIQSLWLSSSHPLAGGWNVGVGPAFLLPTASEPSLGSEKWGAGPTVVALRQSGPWTYGTLFNHIWSFAGDHSRDDVNATLLQPFMAYVTKTKTSFSMNTETTIDWEGDECAVPINFNVAQLARVGGQIFQLSVGARYWASSTDNGPEGLGFRMQLTFLFPK